jgi:hypothetical protein
MSAPIKHTALYFSPKIEKTKYSALSGRKLSELDNPVYFRGDPKIYDLQELRKQWEEYASRGYDMYPVGTHEKGAAQYDQTMDFITRVVPRHLSEMPMKMFVGDMYEIVSVSWDEFISAHNHRVFSHKMIQLLKNSKVNLSGCELPPSILLTPEYEGASTNLDMSLEKTEIFLKQIENWDYFKNATPEKEHFFLNNMDIHNWSYNNFRLVDGGKTLIFGIDDLLQRELYENELKYAVFTYAITLAFKVPVALIQLKKYIPLDPRKRFG